MGARLGQHFLTAPWAAAALAQSLSLTSNEIIVEVGPGKGALTKVLLERGRVVAIEKDERMVQTLREKFANDIISGRLRIVEEDIRSFAPDMIGERTYAVAANIPYYITGEIIKLFLTSLQQPSEMALLIQKEVAQRIVADKESMLSLSVKAYGEPRIVKKVGKGNFSPPPAVDSAIVHIGNISRDFFKDIDESHFFEVLHAGFASKRKKLSNNLGQKYGKETLAKAFELAGIGENSRAEEVHLREWKKLVQEIG